MFEYFGGTPVRIVCDNLKTGVTSHPSKGEIVLNEAYLSLGQYYSVAIVPAGIRKPKHKASVGGICRQNRNRTEIAIHQILPKHMRNAILSCALGIEACKQTYRVLYELFEQRTGVHPTIFVGQYPIEEWHGRLGGGTQADSIMDRIVYNSFEIPKNRTNLRKIYDSKKLKKLIDEIEK